MKQQTLVDVTDFYNEILNFIGSEKFTEMLSATVYANDTTSRNAVIHGLVMTPAIIENMQHYTITDTSATKKDTEVFTNDDIKWIKCEDELPSDSNTVLVTLKVETHNNIYYSTDFGRYYKDKNIWIVNNDISESVIAWSIKPLYCVQKNVT